MRLAHISDLHFAKATCNPSQFFSKRWLGNLNLILFRKREFLPDHLFSLPALFKQLKVDLVIITGDLTTTSRSQEFEAALNFTREIEKEGISVLTLPGNHDQYTKSAYKQKLFYQFFPSDLKEQGIAVKPLANKWQIISLDMAVATSLASSRGLFSEQLEKKLEETLARIPQDASLILTGHFPFFHPDSPRRALIRGEALGKIMQRFPQIKFYLHGHTHRHTIADLRSSGFPIILDSGSATHVQVGTWNLIDINDKGCEIEMYKRENSAPWEASQKLAFKW